MYASQADVDRIAARVPERRRAAPRARELSALKRELTDAPVNLIATRRPDLGDSSPWRIGAAAVHGRCRRAELDADRSRASAAVFDAPEGGSRFTVVGAATRARGAGGRRAPRRGRAGLRGSSLVEQTGRRLGRRQSGALDSPLIAARDRRTALVASAPRTRPACPSPMNTSVVVSPCSSRSGRSVRSRAMPSSEIFVRQMSRRRSDRIAASASMLASVMPGFA